MKGKRKTHSYHLALALLGALLLGCFPDREDFASQSPLLAALERKSGLIAFVGVDGNIYTINQGGAKRQAITADASLPSESDENNTAAKLYLYPTWSPDGRHLAFASISAPGTATAETSIITVAGDGSELTKLYSSEIFQPIYLYWAPRGDNLTFLTSAPTGTLLLQMASIEGGDAQILDAGQPLFWDWAPDGRRLMIHAGGSAPDARLALLTLMDDVVEEGLDLKPTAFQAPDLASDGEKLLLTADVEGSNALVAVDAAGNLLEKVADLGEQPAAFAWSYDNDKVAYIVADEGQSQVLGQLTVVDLEDNGEPVVSEEEQVLGFFWSPDSRLLAYFVPRRFPAPGGEQDGEEEETVFVLGLFIMDVASGTSEIIFGFQPTPEFLSILPFFDQYHRSATIWSPDSKNLVISALSGEDSSTVMVVNASGELDPRPIAEGTLAFWSWD